MRHNSTLTRNYYYHSHLIFSRVKLLNAMLRHLRYVPSCPELRKSLKLRSKEYLRENTLAGFPYFVNPNRPTWERAIWLICTIASLIAALAIIVVIWERFQTSPTLTGIDIQTEELKISLPSIVLCMTSDYLELSQVSTELVTAYKQLYNFQWLPFEGNMPDIKQSLSDVFYQKTPICGNILSNCVDRGQQISCTSLFKKIMTPAGVCCRSPPLPITKDSIDLSVSFALHPDKRLFVYLQEDEYDIPLRDTPITYRPIRNMTFDIALEITEGSEGLRMLSKTQRACIFRDEGPTYNHCVYKCMQTTFLKVCKCVPWFVSNGTSKEDQCSSQQYSCLVEKKSELRHPKCISKCYIYCSHTTYGFETIIDDEARTTVKSKWPQVTFNTDVRFGWLDLIVSFGGIMGLFLGYSILTTFEMVYYFSLRLYCGAIIDNEDNVEKKMKIIEEKKKSDVMPVVYYDFVI